METRKFTYRLTRLIVPAVLAALLLGGCPQPDNGDSGGETKDSKPPQLVQTAPFSRVGKVLTLEFSEAIEDPVKAKIEVHKNKAALSAGYTVAISSRDKKKLEITLTTSPTAGQKYKVVLQAGAVKDLAGNPNALITAGLTITAGPVLKTAPSLSAADRDKLIVEFKADLARTVNSKIKVHKNKAALSAGYTVAISSTDKKKLEITLAPPTKIGHTYQVKFQAAAVFDTEKNGNAADDTNKFTMSFQNFGYKWTDESAKAKRWSLRAGHSSVVFKDKIWVLGGGGGKNDVWSSADGIAWTEETEEKKNAEWPGRRDHASVVFKDRLWVLGGDTGDGGANDVWSSADGINWIEEKTEGTKWSVRQGHASVVFQDRLWVLGGYDAITHKGDVWSSPDGKTWTEEKTKGTKWSVRQGHASVVFKDRLWVLGGYDATTHKDDVWSSPDGKTWTEEKKNAAWSTRMHHSSVVFKNHIWVLGGIGIDDAQYNDAWISPDGKTWIEEKTEGTKWSVRRGHASVVFKDRLWVLGGYDSTTHKDDVWSFGIPAK